MKKYLYLGAVAAMLLGAASCSSDMEPQLADGTVQFRVELPGAIESRAISDGTTATKLDVACYDADGNILAVEPTVKTDFVNREATVTYKLVKGQTYNFAFFAHAAGAPYAFNAGAKLSECSFTVTDNYTGDDCVSNAENRDAFYATLTDYTVSAETKEVTLYRPFAQLNFGTDDLAAAEAAGIIPGTTKVTVKKVATSFNLSTGATTGTVDATFDFATRPNETLTVESKEYAWMAMNYFLVPDNKANVDVEMTANTNKQPVVVSVASVPVKKNHRTNILGSLFTQESNFKVIIDQNFDTPDNNIDYPEVTNVVTMNGQKFETIVAAYNAALEAGQTDIVMTLAKGTYEIPSTFAFEKPNTKINLTVQAATGVNAADITINGRFAMSAASGQRVANGSSMTIKGVSFTTTNTSGAITNASDQYNRVDGTCVYACGAIILTVEDCIFNVAGISNASVFTWANQGTTAVVKNCVFNCEGSGKPIAFSNGSSNSVENCTFNQPKRYAVQVNHYSPSDPVSQLIFKNNTINGSSSNRTYGLVLNSRQEAYYNLNITVADNVLNGGAENSALYAYDTYAYGSISGTDAWNSVNVNNSRDEWVVFVK